MKSILRTLVILFSIVWACGHSRADGLYVGANYHPHDSDPASWQRDVALMQTAGIRVVRLGHLAWDSFEPRDGVYTFEWFDDVMDLMHAAGIRVILDLPVRPAPLWLHQRYPAAGVTDANGTPQYPNHRYMEDVGDPDFRRHALRFTEALASRYARHPALIAFGIDNEPGDGRISYAESCRKRFVAWLREKYVTLDVLNQRWSSQRWSRRIGDWTEIGLPVTAVGVDGPPERVIDFRTFVSDEVRDFFVSVQDVVARVAPGVLTTTNMWYYSPRKYFDYAPIAYRGRLTRAGYGFYPGVSVNDSLDDALFGIARIQYENTTPFWCTEFISATAAPGTMRRAAFASLLLGNQLACVWTWQSMLGGEEQFLQGLVDWDGKPNRKYAEYQQIASEFRKLEAYGFPYVPRAEIAIAFSFASQISSQAFPESHESQALTTFSVLNRRNLDVRVVDLRFSELPYKVLIVPGHAVLDETSAKKLRQFVAAGGCVVMTSQSAVFDENGRVLAAKRPGYLSDVFGIRLGGFEETKLLHELTATGPTGDAIRFSAGRTESTVKAPRFDIIEAESAQVIGEISSLPNRPALVTSHVYGKGLAIYIGVPARAEILDVILDEIVNRLSLRQGPPVPIGVLARQIDAKHILYLNTGLTPKTLTVPPHARSILYERTYEGQLTLDALAPDFVEVP